MYWFLTEWHINIHAVLRTDSLFRQQSELQARVGQVIAAGDLLSFMTQPDLTSKNDARNGTALS